MRRIFLAVAVFLSILSAGCGGNPSAPPANIAGAWDITAQPGTGAASYIAATITENAIGQLSVSATGVCSVNGTYSGVGSIGENNVIIQFPDSEIGVTFTGTFNGSSISGTYTSVNSAGCMGNGSWTASKYVTPSPNR